MLIKEHDELLKHLENIKNEVISIRTLMDKVLSDPAKDYTIMFKGELFEFYPSSTVEEQKELLHKRKRFIISLLRQCLKRSSYYMPCQNELSNKEYYKSFEPLIAFMYGEDPKDHQLEKIVETISPVLQRLADGDTAIPLNKDNYQVIIETNNEDKLKDKYSYLLKDDNV